MMGLDKSQKQTWSNYHHPGCLCCRWTALDLICHKMETLSSEMRSSGRGLWAVMRSITTAWQQTTSTPHLQTIHPSLVRWRIKREKPTLQTSCFISPLATSPTTTQPNITLMYSLNHVVMVTSKLFLSPAVFLSSLFQFAFAPPG